MPAIKKVEQVVLEKLLTTKVDNFLTKTNFSTPYLIVNLDLIAQNYLTLHSELPDTQIYYAVKANPALEILQLLVKLGSKFDTASIAEIEQCLNAGARPQDISFGNTIKKAKDIARAYQLGIRLFAFDSLSELQKISTHAPSSRVYCRLFMECIGAQWPLSKKFGCDLDMAKDLMICSRHLGLQPEGISFHVGSQQLDVNQWDKAIETTANLFRELSHTGIDLQMVNLGGGFPAHYRTPIPEVNLYTQAISTALNKHFGSHQPHTMIEPGRSLVADTGLINTEVVLIAQKSYTDSRRWIFLDIGKFGGLAETMDESIQYRIKTPWDGMPTAPAILAGPTCDSADILYDLADYHLPLNLEIGDRIQILSTGAYTSTYSSVGFNGFAPLKVYCI